jgi:hypothetical protein
MELEGSLPHSQQPATCPYPEPDKSNPHLPSLFLKIYFNIIVPFTSRSCKSGSSFRFPRQDPVYISLLLMRTARPPLPFRLAWSNHSNNSSLTLLDKASGDCLLIRSSLLQSRDRLYWHTLCGVLQHTAKWFCSRTTALQFYALKLRSHSAKSTGEIGIWRWGVPNYLDLQGTVQKRRTLLPHPPSRGLRPYHDVTFRGAKAEQHDDWRWLSRYRG